VPHYDDDRPEDKRYQQFEAGAGSISAARNNKGAQRDNGEH
jgi:hypothetical protein